MMTTKIGRPRIRLVTTRSIFSEVLILAGALVRHSSMMRDHAVALTGDDGLGVVIAILLALGDQLLYASSLLLGEVDELAGVRVALKQLDSVVAALVGGNARRKVVLDVVQNVLDGGVELVLRHWPLEAADFLTCSNSSLDTLVLKSRDHHDRAAELLGKLVNVDLVAILLDQVGHVEGNDHGRPVSMT